MAKKTIETLSQRVGKLKEAVKGAVGGGGQDAAREARKRLKRAQRRLQETKARLVPRAKKSGKKAQEGSEAAA